MVSFTTIASLGSAAFRRVAIKLFVMPSAAAAIGERLGKSQPGLGLSTREASASRLVRRSPGTTRSVLKPQYGRFELSGSSPSADSFEGLCAEGGCQGSTHSASSTASAPLTSAAISGTTPAYSGWLRGKLR